MAELKLFARARAHGNAIALRTDGAAHSYSDLMERSEQVASALLEQSDDLHEARVAFLLPAGFDYVTVQWGIWKSGAVAVPLSRSATVAELRYTLEDSQSKVVVTGADDAEKVTTLTQQLGLRLVEVESIGFGATTQLPEVESHRRAMILYTSGTTSTPKGVVTTHANIQAQIETLVAAWGWRSDDCIPLFLPLHHIHGIINVLSCALWTGATIEPFPAFQMDAILERVAARAYSVFMAVPTIYVKLIQRLESMEDPQPVIDGFAQMRLMISGSAALPASVHEQWTALTTQRLLERYGMTEIGMALSNPYDGERRAGAVGIALPGVEIRLVNEQGDQVSDAQQPGEIQVRGKCVFSEYWDRPDATAESFVDGWFRTGDIAVLEDGYYRIMGRQSVDIIKSGGYKLSALEIESVLLEHDAINQCAVVGLDDETWGEAVAAAVVLEQDQHLTLENLKEWCRDRLSHYKIPKYLKVTKELPRNAMGKIQKPAVKELFK